MERRRAVVVMLFATVAAWLVARGSAAGGAEESRSPECRLLFTGDLRGTLEPCGCEAGQFGGLARRATLLAQERKSDDLLIELGGLSSGVEEADSIGWRVALLMLRSMRYDAYVPGGADLGLLDLHPAALADGPPAICANLVRTSDRSLVLAPSAVRTLSSGRRMAVIGLTSRPDRLPPGLDVTSAVEAAADAVHSLSGKADGIVIAGWIDGQTALDVAAAVPSATVVLASRVSKGTFAVVRRGGAPIASGGERGQYVAALRLGSEAADLRRIWMDAAIPDDESVRAAVIDWKRRLSEVGAAASAAARERLLQDGWIGSRACTECHKAEHDSWSASKHSHAVATLVAKGEATNALCIRCHDRDRPAPSSSAAPTSDGGVGCEACHGPGRLHAEARRQGRATGTMDRMGDVADSKCTTCHDDANSPRFEFQTYWQRIAHGVTPRVRLNSDSPLTPVEPGR